mmetsp:Transcript_24459/g.31113  ORF Transcript_24459/g.31113 Transcript_24459/m.31113 type:complete len:206 (-) Transcript_24459:39-656(-)
MEHRVSNDVSEILGSLSMRVFTKTSSKMRNTDKSMPSCFKDTWEDLQKKHMVYMLLVCRKISGSLLADCDQDHFAERPDLLELITELTPSANVAFEKECRNLQSALVFFRNQLRGKKVPRKTFGADKKNHKIDECIAVVEKYIEKWKFINENIIWLFEPESEPTVSISASLPTLKERVASQCTEKKTKHNRGSFIVSPRRGSLIG